MTLYQFNALPYDARLATVQEMGTYLAIRWAGATAAVLLYHLPGEVFAEIYYDTHARQISDLRAFVSTAALAHYAPFIFLPDELDGL